MDPAEPGKPSLASVSASFAGAIRAVAPSDAAAESTPARTSHGAYDDVWHWTSPRYRVRAVLLLVLTFLLYCGLCCFVHWLHVARPFDFSWESYAAPARVSGADAPTLNDFVLYPINVLQTPAHAVVLGLLVASIVAVPIVVAILYRFVFALPFVAAVPIFAHLPWMGVTLLTSCILAGVRPFRLPFRFGAALLGMLPVLAYLYLATRGSAQLEAYASPAGRTLLIAPWVLAILAACAMMAVVLLISRAVNYRPGAIAPVLSLMFAAPVILFHLRVGADELYYRILESQYGPRSPRFEPVRDARPDIRAILTRTSSPLYERYLATVWGGEIDPLKRGIWQQMLLDLFATRAEAFDACKYFLADHPRSRYAPSVLFIQGRILDTRLDARRLAGNPPIRELYSDYPHPQSESAWAALHRGYPESPLAIAAGLRLAQLSLRRGEVETAGELLREVLRRGAQYRATTGRGSSTQPSPVPLLEPAAPEDGLEFQPRPYLLEAERLAELIAANRDCPRFAAAPLAALAGLDPHAPRYAERLLDLADRYPQALLYDNLLVQWALAQPGADDRDTALARLVETLDDGDARPEALFRLAEAELRPGTPEAPARLVRARARLTEVATRFQETLWGRLAGERLRLLDPPIAGAVTP